MNRKVVLYYVFEGFTCYENVLMSFIRFENRFDRPFLMTNKELAELCGVSTKTISTAISKFVDDGYIRTIFDGRKRLVILLKEPKRIEYGEEYGN